MNDNNMVEYLRILDFRLSEAPTPAEVKSRWKELCRKHHPDLGGDPEMFKKITHAYKMLTDASYRAAARDGSSDHALNLDITIQFPLAFDEAFFGKTFAFNFSVSEVDPETKHIVYKKDLEIESVMCQIAPGSFRGADVLMTSKGQRSGNARGNLIFKPIVQNNPKYTLEAVGGNCFNTICSEPIPLETMLKGGKIDVLTMHGVKVLKVRPGTAPEQRLVIKGAGCNGGNHVVIAKPQFPGEDELKGGVWTGLGIVWNQETEAEDKEELDFMKVLQGAAEIALGYKKPKAKVKK